MARKTVFTKRMSKTRRGSAVAYGTSGVFKEYDEWRKSKVQFYHMHGGLKVYATFSLRAAACCFLTRPNARIPFSKVTWILSVSMSSARRKLRS